MRARLARGWGGLIPLHMSKPLKPRTGRAEKAAAFSDCESSEEDLPTKHRGDSRGSSL
jgi:hypothetical protein